MKALLVNGSPHKAGNTATALAEVANPTFHIRRKKWCVS